MNKMFGLLLAVSLIGCNGGGGNTNDSQSLSMSFNGQEISRVDFVNSIGQAKFEITNTDKDAVVINSIAIANDSIDTIDSKNTTCIGSIANGHKCTLAINLNGIYTQKQQLNILFNSNNGVLSIPVAVWNYNYTKPSLFLTVESDNNSNFESWSTLSKPAGDIHFILTNTGGSPIFIQKINLDTIDPYNKLIESNNLCKGTLRKSQSCYFVGSYVPSGRYDYPGLHESIIISYLGGESKIAYSNKITAPSVQVFASCQNLGICKLNFYNPVTSGKVILRNFGNFETYLPENLTMLPAESNGCVKGMILPSGSSSCGFNFIAKSLPVLWHLDKLDANYQYYIDESEDIYSNGYTTNNESVDVRIFAQNDLNISGTLWPVYSRCTNFGGRGDTSSKMQMRVGYYEGNYHIKSVEFVAGTTNYTDYANKKVITPEEAIISDACTGTTVSKDKMCIIELQSGCQGYGNAGTVTVKYTYNDNPTEFTYVQHLGEVAQPDVEVGVCVADEVECSTIWRTGQPTPKPISITSIHPSILAHFSNWDISGSYTKISENYDMYKARGVPSCFGNMGMDSSDNFWATGFGQDCGISMDFSSVASGTQIPISLSVGNRAQDTLHFIFNVQ